MIIDLDKIENLILQSNRASLIKALQYISNLKNENLKNVFYNLTLSTSLKDVDINFILIFLYKVKYLELKDDKVYRRRQFVPNKLIEELIFFYYSLLINNKELNEALFLNSEFKIIKDEISINIFSVHIKYRMFFTILQNLGLLVKTEEKGVVLIKHYFLAKKFLERPLRKISPKEFEKEQEQKKLFGVEAEKFVIAFEKKRLGDKKIDWIAEYIVNAGYDIASFNLRDDIEYNRFIEVKSYDGDIPYFYWSRNEMHFAERNSNKYWIYLVNRKEMNKINYEPRMEQNPFKNIFKNENWDKEVENYKIMLINKT